MLRETSLSKRRLVLAIAAIAGLFQAVGYGQGGQQPARLHPRRIAVFGSADVAGNRFVDLFGNADLVTGVIQFVGKANDVIAAGRDDPGGAYKLVLTAAQKGDVVRRGIVFPSAAVLLPFPLALWRLKRG